MATTAIHKFEEAGLGKAPFRFVRVEERVGPMIISVENGITTTVGAPGQPCGTCDYCGTAIKECCIIRSADGRQFIVGNQCVHKTGDSGLESATKKAINKKRTEARHAREDDRIEDARRSLKREDVRMCLESDPHPLKWRADQGETKLGWARWMMENAGRRGAMDVVRCVERTEKSLA